MHARTLGDEPNFVIMSARGMTRTSVTKSPETSNHDRNEGNTQFGRMGVHEWSSRGNRDEQSSSERWTPAAPCASLAETCSCSHYAEKTLLDWGRRCTMSMMILKMAPWPQKLIVTLSVVQGIYLMCQQLPDFVDVEQKYREERKEKGSKKANANLGVDELRLLLIHTAIVAPAVVYFAVESIVTDNVRSRQCECNNFVYFYAGKGLVYGLQTSELVGFVVLAFLLTVRIVTDEILIQDEDTLGISLAIATFVFIVIYVLLFYRTYKDLKRKRFLSIGPNPRIGFLFRMHQRFVSVKKLDGLFVAVIIVTVIFLTQSPGSNPTTLQLILVALLVIAEIAWVLVGNLAISKKDGYMLYLFWALSTLLPVVLITFATQTASKGDDESFNEFHENPMDENDPMRLATMIAIGGISIVLRMLTVYCSILLYNNFGQEYTRMLGLVKEGVFIFETYLNSVETSNNDLPDISGKFVMEMEHQKGYSDTEPERPTRSTVGSSDLESFEAVEQTLRPPTNETQVTHNLAFNSSVGTSGNDNRHINWTKRQRQRSNERFLAKFDCRSQSFNERK